MPVKRSAILRWTGMGSPRDLLSSIGHVLRAHRAGADVSLVGWSVLASRSDPIQVASILQHMPGVAWIAAGYAGSQSEVREAAAALAKLYLRRGDMFSVLAEGTGGALASDLGGAATSSILDSVKGARVSERPRIVFRAVEDGKKCAVGVELKLGPGGIPTGSESAVCMVSGGVHSGVAAWMATLAGFRVRLVHARVSEQSLLAVARLYSELSNRADPRGLSLEVLEGGSVPGMIADYTYKATGRLFGGFHAAGGDVPPSLKGGVASPLYLLPESGFRSEFESLGTKPFELKQRWDRGQGGMVSSRTFSGGPADVNGVLDGLA